MASTPFLSFIQSSIERPSAGPAGVHIFVLFRHCCTHVRVCRRRVSSSRRDDGVGTASVRKAKKNKARSLVFKVSRDLYPSPVAASARAKDLILPRLDREIGKNLYSLPVLWPETSPKVGRCHLIFCIIVTVTENFSVDFEIEISVITAPIFRDEPVQRFPRPIWRGGRARGFTSPCEASMNARIQRHFARFHH